MKIERWKSRPKIISEGRKEGRKGLKLSLIPRISITPLSLQLINTRRSNTDRVISDLFLKKIRKKSSVSRVRDQVSKVWRALALGGGRRWTDGWMDGWMDGRMGGGRRINLDMFAEQSNIWVESLAGVIDWFGRWCGESGEQWKGSRRNGNGERSTKLVYIVVLGAEGHSGLSGVCCSPLFEGRGGKHSFREGRSHGRAHTTTCDERKLLLSLFKGKRWEKLYLSYYLYLKGFCRRSRHSLAMELQWNERKRKEGFEQWI